MQGGTELREITAVEEQTLMVRHLDDQTDHLDPLAYRTQDGIACLRDCRRHQVTAMETPQTDISRQGGPMIRVEVKPALWQRAVERSGDRAGTAPRLPQLMAWQRGKARPTLKQLEAFARTAVFPWVICSFPTRPTKSCQFRTSGTLGGRGVQQPSPDLLDVVYLCQHRQASYSGLCR